MPSWEPEHDITKVLAASPRYIKRTFGFVDKYATLDSFSSRTVANVPPTHTFELYESSVEGADVSLCTRKNPVTRVRQWHMHIRPYHNIKIPQNGGIGHTQGHQLD